MRVLRWMGVGACVLVGACGSTPDAVSPSPESSASGSATSAPSGAASSAASAAAPSSSASVRAPTASPAAPPVELVVDAAAPPAAPKVPALAILAPTKHQVLAATKAAAFEVKISAKDLSSGNSGDRVCVAFDRKRCVAVADASKPIRLGDLGSLEDGPHVISVLAQRADGTFFRPAGKSVPFASVSFFIGKKGPTSHKDGAPMLFFSPPLEASGKGDVLLDFYVANAEVASGKVVLHATVGGPGIEQGVGISVHENKPLRLKNPRPGEYVARFSLMQFVPDLGESKSLTSVTYTARPVSGPFGEIERSVRVSP